MSALREVFARFSVDVDDRKLDGLNKKTTEGAKKLGEFGKYIRGALAVTGVGAFVKHLADLGSEIEDNSRRLGLSTDAYQELGFAAGQAGGSVEELSNAMLVMQDKLADAAKGGEGAKAFKALGISAKDANGDVRDSEAVFADAAEAISKMDSPAKQTAAAVDIFGKAGRRLLPMLKEGRAGLEKMRKEARELGGGFSEAAVKASDDFGDSLDKVKFLVSSVQGRIAQKLLPVLQRGVEWAIAIGKKFLEWSKNSRILEATLVTLGTVAAAFAAAAIAPFLFWGAIIGALILAIDELWTTIDGGDTYLRDFIDAQLGLGATEEIVEKLKVAWVSIVEAIKDSIQWVKDFISSIESAYRKSRELLGLGNEPEASPGSSRIGVTHHTQGEQRAAMRLAAARMGQSLRFKGESDAEFAMGMGNARISLAAERSLRGPGAGAGANVNAPVTVNINAPNADAREVARLAREEMERGMRAVNAAAAQALTREAPAR